MAYECPYCGASQANKEQHQKHVKACFEDRAAYKVKQGMKPLTEKMIQEMKERARKERPGEISLERWSKTLLNSLNCSNFEDLGRKTRKTLLNSMLSLLNPVESIPEVQKSRELEPIQQIQPLQQVAQQEYGACEEGIEARGLPFNKFNKEFRKEVKI